MISENILSESVVFFTIWDLSLLVDAPVSTQMQWFTWYFILYCEMKVKCMTKSKSHRLIFYTMFLMWWHLHCKGPPRLMLYGNALIWYVNTSTSIWLADWLSRITCSKTLNYLFITGLFSMIYLYTLLLLWWHLDDINTTLSIWEYSSLSRIGFL